MPGYGQTQRTPAQKSADGGAADRRSEPTREHAGAADALGASLNRSPRSQSLMQLRAALDASPRVQALQRLTRALNRTHHEEHDGPEQEPPDVHAPMQFAAMPDDAGKPDDPPPAEKKPNATGLPDRLKASVEQLSGLALDDVRVHYNSQKPAAVQAHAYAQGTDIHVAPGQEKHLPHEAWHVVQQKQGRVKPTLQMKGVAINDDAGLEREADVHAEKARLMDLVTSLPRTSNSRLSAPSLNSKPRLIQRKKWVWNATKNGWDPFDANERGGQAPSDRGDKDGNIYDDVTQKWYIDRNHYLSMTEEVKFESQPFVNPVLSDPPDEGVAFPGAFNTLSEFLTGGVKTPADLKKEGKKALQSADALSDDERISVNVLKGQSGTTPEAIAKYAITHAANGAIPVILERKDEAADLKDVELSSRAQHSALAIIKPDELGRAQKKAVSEMPGAASETSLTGSIAASNFVKVLVPVQFKKHFQDASALGQLGSVDMTKIQFVGSKTASFKINTQEAVRTISAPDYESALAAILTANPNATFLTHAIRLPDKKIIDNSAITNNPITNNPETQPSVSAGQTNNNQNNNEPRNDDFDFR